MPDQEPCRSALRLAITWVVAFSAPMVCHSQSERTNAVETETDTDATIQVSIPDQQIATYGFQTDVHFSSLVRWNDQEQEVAVLSGIRIKMAPGTPEMVAHDFLSTYGSSLGLPADRFVVSGYRDSPAGGRRIFFQEMDAGIPIPGAGLTIGVNRTPELISETGSITGESIQAFRSPEVKGNLKKLPYNLPPSGFGYYFLPEILDFDTSRDDWHVYFLMRQYQESLPKQLTETNVAVPPEVKSVRPETRVVSLSSRFKIAGIGSALSLPQSSGRPITSPAGRSRSREGCSSNDFSGTGSAIVFPTNPNHGESALVTLDNLCNQSPIILEGNHVTVLPETELRSSSEFGTFLASAGTTTFDEASVYYHIDRYVSLMKDSGMYTIIPDDYRIEAIVRSEERFLAVARFNFTKLEFGVFDFPFLNPVHESAVIAHETTHLLMFDLYSPSYLGKAVKEHFAMGEAYADYFALAYRARQMGNSEPWHFPVIGSYFVLETVDTLPRDLTDPAPHFSGWLTTNYVGHGEGVSNSDVYDNAMIYSTALMDYDRADESDHSLSYVVESLSNITGAPSFLMGRTALEVAVNGCALIKVPMNEAPGQTVCCNSGSCSQPVERAFAGRGIGTFDPDIIPIDIETESIPGRTNLTIEGNYPSPFPHSTIIVFRLGEPAVVRIRIVDLQGREVSSLASKHFGTGQHEISWRPEGLPSGMYFYEISTGASVQRKAIFYVR